MKMVKLKMLVALMCLKLAFALSADSVSAANDTMNACGCLNGGQCLKDSGKCKCSVGFAGDKCNIGVTCCNIYGDPHYLTFDGAKIDFQGECRYHAVGVSPCAVTKMAMSLPNFQVRVENWRRGKVTKVSWTRMVEVQLAGHKVTIDVDKEVYVDDAQVNLPYRTIAGVSIHHSGEFIRLSTTYGASVSFDSKDRLVICVPNTWQGVTNGLCGNFNGNFRDDYVTKGGRNVFSMEKSKRSILIGNSWRVPSDNGCNEEKHTVTPRPSKSWKKMAETNKYCGAIIKTKGPFKKCIEKLGNEKIKSFYENCKFDVFELHPDKDEAKNMACNVLQALLTECREMGVPPENSWRKYTSCTLKCPKGTVYSADTSSCPATCADPDAPSKCLQPNTEGCVCKTGFLLSNNKCTPKSKCGCTDEYGSYHKLSTKWFSKDCSKRYICQRGKTKTQQSYAKEIPACKKGYTCKAVTGMVKCIRIPVPGGWSSFSKWSECTEFCGQDHKVRVRTRRCTNPKPKYGGKCQGEAFELKTCL